MLWKTTVATPFDDSKELRSWVLPLHFSYCISATAFQVLHFSRSISAIAFQPLHTYNRCTFLDTLGFPAARCARLSSSCAGSYT